jgi:pyridoxine 5'-phosphate synthase PdxJ
VILAELAGAEGITVHLRSDRRHIKDRDVELLRQMMQARLTIEMAATPEMVEIACRVKPDQVTLVPDRPEEVTTTGELDVAANRSAVRLAVERCQPVGIRVGNSVDAAAAQVDASKEVGADAIEINTGPYADAPDGDKPQQLARIRESAERMVGMKRRRGLHGSVVAYVARHISTRSPCDDGAHTGRPAAMDIIGLDLHKRDSQLSIKAEDGTITERRIVTSRERFTAVLGGRGQARILLEAPTESKWVARHLESLGHEVIVADPNYAPMYANRSRSTKTDKRDARTLLDACETNAYRPAHRLFEARRRVRAELAVRESS